ncbi:MAG TPA: LytTR family DNA-binding domain-containing protein [Thermoanaerobaculia bacterium]|nr:LytTR family DNA-binding domain-containing protein [Thermoanaerobaculia bacterium]
MPTRGSPPHAARDRRLFRIHRSAIVRLDAIDLFLRHAGGAYGVRLKNGVELSVSRNKREELEARLFRSAAAEPPLS